MTGTIYTRDCVNREWPDLLVYKYINIFIFVFSLQMQNLKRDDPSLKTLLAIGGWTHGSNGFTQMVNNKNNIQRFVSNSLAYIKEYGEFVPFKIILDAKIFLR